MAFVKLDTRILESTLWVERAQREMFITALLMAMPQEITEPMPAINVRNLEPTGFVVPPGWYGFIDAAGVGIVRRALLEIEQGLDALEALGSPDLGSRTADFEGRRLVRVNGGYIVLNYMRFRDHDSNAATRMKLLRERKKAAANVTANGCGVTANERNDSDALRRTVTEAEAEAEVKEQEIFTEQAQVLPSRFEEFWQLYPNKTGKKVCAGKWKSRKLDHVASQIIWDVRRRLENDRRWREGFVPNPETYINQDRWNDGLPPANGARGQRSSGADAPGATDMAYLNLVGK